jgi:hypothetical protein
MICEFQKQHKLDYVDRRKTVDEKNTSTALDNRDGGMKHPWVDKGNSRSEFPVTSVHESIKSARKSVREDLELRRVTNLSEERKRFYLIATLLDPRIKVLSFFDSFYMYHTQGEVNHVDGQVPKPSVLDDLSGVSSTSMDVDPSFVNGTLGTYQLLLISQSHYQ